MKIFTENMYMRFSFTTNDYWFQKFKINYYIYFFLQDLFCRKARWLFVIIHFLLRESIPFSQTLRHIHFILRLSLDSMLCPNRLNDVIALFREEVLSANLFRSDAPREKNGMISRWKVNSSNECVSLIS